MDIGTWQIIVILVVVLLLFGGRKIPELAQGLGKGIKNFKDAVKEGEDGDEIKKTEQIDNKSQNEQDNLQNTSSKKEDKNINA